MSACSLSSALYTSSAVMCRIAEVWKTSRILMRGRVALRPLLFSSSTWLIRWRALERGPDRISTHHSHSGPRARQAVHSTTMSVLQLARTLASAVAATALGCVLAGCSAVSADGSLLGIVTPY